MLTKGTVFLVALFLSKLCFGQAQDSTKGAINESLPKRAYIGLSYGFSIPMGSFSAKNANLVSSAFAKNGQSIHLFNFGYQFSNSLSGKVFYLNATNSVDENLLGNNLSKSSPKNYTVQASDYELKALLFGIGINKINSALDLDLHFLLGYGSSFLPSFTLIESDPTNSSTQTINFKPSKEQGFGVGLSAGLRIHLNSQFDFMTQAAYIIFEKKFKQLRVDNFSTSTTESRISYEVLTLNFGFAYRFNIESKN